MAGEVGSLAAQRIKSGPASWPKHSWHAAAAHAYPANFEGGDQSVQRIIEHAVRGHLPNEPLLDGASSVVTLGSCFAAELRHFLVEVGLESDSFWVPSGLNNTYALLDFISWCVTGKQTGKGFRYDRVSDGSIQDWTPEHERERYLESLRTAGAFVFTIGLAEVWEDSETSEVFWRGVPQSIFREDRHRFRVTTVEENRANLGRIIDLIREVNADVPIVLTLSPVPLKATFREISCMSADCVSKSILRVALDETLREARPGVYYWPSFEVVKWGGCHLPYPVYGTDDGTVRHVSRFVVMNVLLEFVRRFYGEDTYAEAKLKYETAMTTEPGGPGQPPLLIRGVFVRA